MAYQVQNLHSDGLVKTNKGFEIWARQPFGDEVDFDIYGSQIKYQSERVADLFREIETLAESMGLPKPSRDAKDKYLCMKFKVGEYTADTILVKLAELVDKKDW